MSVQSRDLQMISVERTCGFGEKKRRQGSIKLRRKRRQRARRLCMGFMVVCAGLIVVISYKANGLMQLPAMDSGEAQVQGLQEKIIREESRETYPKELAELLEQNKETYDFVENYPNRETYAGKEIDLSDDVTSGSVPLLMQWDKRWGYDMYGDSMIGIAGCGPVCMTMAYLYFTEDLEMNPRQMAEFAQNQGYHSKEGTSWEFWTSGAKGLGLFGEVISLNENVMKTVLDCGGLIVCSMSPGDFTTQGHYILLRGYDENGFFVNDPNRRENSEKQWDFQTLSHQIKNLWGIYDPGR